MDTVPLTYLQVHLYYTLPVSLLLWTISRPFTTTRLWTQILALVAVAVVYTTPWDNYLVWTGTWYYSKDAVLGTIGYVPLEEYFFFIIQTVMVVLWAFLCLRWSVPYLHLRHDSALKAQAIRCYPIPLMLAIAALAWITATPKTPYFYICSILWWILPVIAFLWYGAGNFVVKQLKAVSIAVLVPSVYLGWVDLVALRDAVWSISPEATSRVFAYDVLPVEEAFFFFIVNIILVLGYCGFEKAFSVLDMYPELFANDGNIILKLLKAFAVSEASLPQRPIEDLQLTLDVLKKASKSFWAAGFLFPSDVRHDLSVLYAFCRVTDDMVDNASSEKERRSKLDVITKFLDQLFQDRLQTKDSWIYGLGKQQLTPFRNLSIDWKYFEDFLNPEEIAAFRSLSKISYYLPPEPFYELCRGYEWDLSGRNVETEAELLEYSQFVASSVAVLCTYVLCFKSGRTPNGLNEEEHRVMIDLARDMGIALQLTNIARDIATDSETLGRCYVPASYFENPDELRALIQDKNPWSLGNKRLRDLSIRILDLGAKYQKQARAGFNALPSETLRPIICATEIYAGIGRVIRNEPEYPNRASVGTLEKISIVMRCLYFPLSMVKKGNDL